MANVLKIWDQSQQAYIPISGGGVSGGSDLYVGEEEPTQKYPIWINPKGNVYNAAGGGNTRCFYTVATTEEVEKISFDLINDFTKDKLLMIFVKTGSADFKFTIGFDLPKGASKYTSYAYNNNITAQYGLWFKAIIGYTSNNYETPVYLTSKNGFLPTSGPYWNDTIIDKPSINIYSRASDTVFPIGTVVEITEVLL